MHRKHMVIDESSVVRFADFMAETAEHPSAKALGYFHSVRYADVKKGPSQQSSGRR